jgi:hypothetical protein
MKIETMDVDTAKRIAREIIEAGEMATPGPWAVTNEKYINTCYMAWVRSPTDDDNEAVSVGSQRKSVDANFTVLARNFAPEVLKVLLEENKARRLLCEAYRTNDHRKADKALTMLEELEKK